MPLSPKCVRAISRPTLAMVRGVKALLKSSAPGKLSKSGRFSCFRARTASNRPTGPRLRGITKLLCQRVHSKATLPTRSSWRGSTWSGEGGVPRRPSRRPSRRRRLDMLRRQARLRREFVYRKSLEGKERELYEKKRKIRQCLEDGRPIPTELRKEEEKLREEVHAEDAKTATYGARDVVDDEYAKAAESEPRVLLTTSRDPSSRLQQFAKELKLLFPTSQRINRGSQILPDLMELCRNGDFTDLVMVHEHRGEPDGLVISHLPFGPTCYFGISNTVMRHDIKDQDIGHVSEVFPHLILENFTSALGKRTATVLKHLFPEPKAKSKRVVTFANDADYISLRHHMYEMPKGAKSVSLTEIGPRFELRLYQIKLGTVEMDDADIEWSLRPFMRSGKKARL